MTKNVLKIALLAAAAFMLAFLPACSDGGGDSGSSSVAVTGVTVSADKTTLYVSGDNEPHTATLTATVAPDNATDKTVSWLSSDSTVAEVSPATGSEITVTARSAGVVTVTAKAANDKTATVELTMFADKASQDMFSSIVGSYEAGEISINIDAAGFVTVGDKKSDKPAVVDGSKLTVTIDGAPHTITVANDGSLTFDGTAMKALKPTLRKNDGEPTEYDTIKDALAAIPATGTDTYTITLQPGKYRENGLSYNGSATVVIEGNTDATYGKDVVIMGKGSSQLDSKSRCLLYVDGTANVVLKNVTLQNTLERNDPTIPTNASGSKLTQAEAFGFGSSGTVTAYNASFLGHQDTVRTVGKAWFYQCYFEGDVDFLWMETSGQVALYEDCEIKMVGDETNRAYIAAPGLAQTSPVGKGLVIYNSKVIVDPKVTEGYLARTPWNDGKYNQVAYINTTIDGTLKAVWYGAPIATEFPKTDIGWKLCPVTAAACDHTGEDVLSERMTAREYNGRYVILNRVFDTKAKQYKTAETLWDAAKVIGITDGDASKNNIFLDYADVTKTSIGDELVVTDFGGEATGVTWSVKAFAKYEGGVLSEEVSGVTIDASTGAITNNYSGNVYAEVTATKGSASDSIILYNVSATAISLSQTTVSIAEGSDVTLTATFEPEGADAEVVWTSNDASIATVEGGKVVAQTGKAGSTATITATIKGTDIKATCTVTVTAAVSLKKFGTSVAEAELQAYKGFGLNEVLVYDKPIVPGDGVSASITATITTKGKKVGVGFVSFRDGAYKDGALDGMMFVTDQGVRYKKDYTSGWNGSWTSGAAKPTDTAANGAEYVMTAKVDGKNLSIVVVDEAGKEYTYSNTNIGNFISATSLYLAIGGESENAGEMLNVNTVEIKTSDGGGKVANLVDLGTRTQVTYTPDSSKAVYTISGTGKGQDAVIAKADLPALKDIITLSVADGTLEWDADVTIKNSDWNNDTATIKPTFTFLPTAQNQYAALFNKEVEITVTDARTVDNNSGKISWFSEAAESTSLAADNAASNSLASGSNAVLLYKGTDAVTDDKLSANVTARKVTGLAYKPGTYSFSANDVAITYEMPFTVGDSDITLSNFSYSWACTASNNFTGSVSVFGDNHASLKTTKKIQSDSNVGGIGNSTTPTEVDLSVPISANTSGKIVITIDACGSVSNKSNDFVIGETVLKFSKN